MKVEMFFWECWFLSVWFDDQWLLGCFKVSYYGEAYWRFSLLPVLKVCAEGAEPWNLVRMKCRKQKKGALALQSLNITRTTYVSQPRDSPWCRFQGWRSPDRIFVHTCYEDFGAMPLSRQAIFQNAAIAICALLFIGVQTMVCICSRC